LFVLMQRFVDGDRLPGILLTHRQMSRIVRWYAGRPLDFNYPIAAIA
jgi:hypothetical protein